MLDLSVVLAALVVRGNALDASHDLFINSEWLGALMTVVSPADKHWAV